MPVTQCRQHTKQTYYENCNDIFYPFTLFLHKLLKGGISFPMYNGSYPMLGDEPLMK